MKLREREKEEKDPCVCTRNALMIFAVKGAKQTVCTLLHSKSACFYYLASGTSLFKHLCGVFGTVAPYAVSDNSFLFCF